MSAVAPNDCFRGAKERGTMGQERTLAHPWSIVTLSALLPLVLNSVNVSCWHIPEVQRASKVRQLRP